MKNKKNIVKNSFIYAFKSVISLLFPLITYPYSTRVLSIASIGKVNFAASIISYFSLISGLGIYTFAVREGAKIRDDKTKITLLSSEVFTINVVSTVLAYVLFLFMFIFNEKWHNYTCILFIISVTIPLSTIGVDWLFTIYEEYTYITLRTIFVQILSVFFLIVFVKNDSDLYMYAVYTVFTSVGSNVFNIIRSRKYVKLRIIFDKKMISYLKPMIVLFASSIATQIYLNSDITILGYMTSDEDVGLYNSAVKIYNIAKNILLSIGTVSMPSLAYILGQNNRIAYEIQLKKIMCVIVFFAIPCAFGLASIATDVIVIFAGEKYTKAGSLLQVLAFALPFSIVGSYLASGCLVLFGKENKILNATIIGSITNMALNFIYIPSLGAIAAAISTLISELITVSIHLYNVKKICNFSSIKNSIMKTVVASVGMFGVCLLFKTLEINIILRIIWCVLMGVFFYLSASLFIHNDVMIEICASIKKKRIILKK